MPRASADPRIFVSYARSDGEAFARALREKLAGRGFSLWHDRQDMAGGRNWWRQITEAIDRVEYLVLVMTPAAVRSETVRREWRYARQQGRCVVPVMGTKPLDFSGLPRWMASAHFYDLDILEQEKRFIRQLESPCTTPRVPMMAPPPPADYVPRPDEFAALKTALLDPRGEPVAITSALKGAGGYGKTTLAKALCADNAIQDAYHDGILWVTLGESPGEPQGRIEDLIHVLQGRRESFATRDAALTRLAEILADQRCLLVIDDVWHRGDAEPFLQAGPRCARLLTTRNTDTLPPDAVDIRVDEMQTEQAIELLQKGLPSADPAKLHQLAARLGEWPLLLKLVNGALRERVDKLRAPLPEALRDIEKRLDKRGLAAFDATNARAREEAVAKTLGLSLDQLQGEDPTLPTRLNELAVFPEDVSIPVQTVALLWQQTAALDEIDSEDLLQRLFRLSLLLDLDLAERTARLHDVVRTWLRREVGAARLAELDGALVAGYSDRCDGAWHQLPDDGYVLRHLPSHLRTADATAWRELLLDPCWMARKLSILGTTALVADYETTDEDDLRLIRDALRLSAHVLGRDPAQLAAQLCGRLGGSEQSAHIRLMRAAHAGVERISLLPRFASFTAPGGPLLRTLAGHVERVIAVAVTPDGRHAVSASWDRTLKVWDLASGVELRTLQGHAGGVSTVAVTPDGRLAILASEDGTLKVWDLASGVELRTFHWVDAVAVTPDGRQAVSASEDRTLKVWDLASGVELRTLQGYGGRVKAVAVTPDGRQAVSASEDRTLKVWDLAGGEIRATLAGDHTMSCVATVSDRLFVAGDAGGTVHVLELVEPQTVPS